MIDLSAQFAATFVLYAIPLWPAGPGPTLWLRAFVVRKTKSLAFRRLRRPLLTPRKGGDHAVASLSPTANVAGNAPPPTLPISPLAGEMSGRTEGGAVSPVFLRRNMP
jgi:hypothetical protein